MGTTMITFGGLLAPLHNLMLRLARAAGAGHSSATARRQCALPAVRPALHSPARACAPKPLRVVRVLDSAQARNGAGRMVISGRMADVCAELDRLAALEAAAS